MTKYFNPTFFYETMPNSQDSDYGLKSVRLVNFTLKEINVQNGATGDLQVNCCVSLMVIFRLTFSVPHF